MPNTNTTTKNVPKGLLRWSQRQAVAHRAAAWSDITVYSVPVTLLPGYTLEQVLPEISKAMWLREVNTPKRGGIIGSSYGNVSKSVDGIDPQRPGNILISTSFYIGD